MPLKKWPISKVHQSCLQPWAGIAASLSFKVSPHRVYDNVEHLGFQKPRTKI